MTNTTAVHPPMATVTNMLDVLRGNVDRLNAELSDRDRELAEKTRMLDLLADVYSRDRRARAIETLKSMPASLSAALEFAAAGALVTVPVVGHEVTFVLTGTPALTTVAQASAWEKSEAIVDEVGSDPIAAAGLVRTELPDPVAALVWRQDGHPVVVCSWSTKRQALRRALHAAGHQVVGGAA